MFWAGSSVRIEHRPPKSLDSIDQIDWQQFKTWIFNKYSNSSAITFYCYAKKYCYLLTEVRGIENLSPTIKNNVIKSLIILSKYLGFHENFKQKLKNHGIKTTTPNSLRSFLRILNANNTDTLKWYNEAITVLRENERILLKFLLKSGLRKGESVESFNKVIELNKFGNLDDYYDSKLNCLCHFKYKEFIRRTKNCYITFITEDLLNEIANSEPVNYNALRIRLNRKNMKCRINELRDYYGTYLLQHGILEAEINLCQGRIPPSIFIKHYWSPKLSELRDRIFKALKDLESTKRI